MAIRRMLLELTHFISHIYPLSFAVSVQPFQLLS